MATDRQLRALRIIAEGSVERPGQFALLMWPDAEAWRRPAKCGNHGVSKGGGMRTVGSTYLGKEAVMVALTHYIVRTVQPGYWGKGVTIREAIKNAEYIEAGDAVHLIRCDEKAYIDALGTLQYTERERLGTAIVADDGGSLKDIDPKGGLA